MSAQLDNTQVSASLQREDLQSLLWEVRDLLQSLGEVNATQAAQLARLSNAPPAYDDHSEGYVTRTRAAINALDITLSHLDALEDDTHLEAESDFDDAESSFDVSPVHAWLQAVSVSSRENEPEERSSQPQENVQEASDFWAIHSELRFDEEPEPSPVSSSGLSLPELDLDSVDSVSTFEADDVSPWDSVSARDESRSLSGHEYYEYEEADVEEDEQQRDDSSTLYSEAEDDEMARVLQRHAFLTGKPVDLALHRMSSPWTDRTPSSPMGFNAARLFAEQPAVLAGF